MGKEHSCLVELRHRYQSGMDAKNEEVEVGLSEPLLEGAYGVQETGSHRMVAVPPNNHRCVVRTTKIRKLEGCLEGAAGRSEQRVVDEADLEGDHEHREIDCLRSHKDKLDMMDQPGHFGGGLA